MKNQNQKKKNQNQWTSKIKWKQTHRYKEQINGYQRGKRVDKIGEGVQLFGDGW